MVNPIPDGYRAVTPYLIVDGGAKAVAFYALVFGAVERERIEGPGGKIGHAEITIGDSWIMLADEHPEVGRSARPRSAAHRSRCMSMSPTSMTSSRGPSRPAPG